MSRFLVKLLKVEVEIGVPLILFLFAFRFVRFLCPLAKPSLQYYVMEIVTLFI